MELFSLCTLLLSIPILSVIILAIAYKYRITVPGTLTLHMAAVLANITVHIFFEKLIFKLTKNYSLNSLFLDKEFAQKYISPTVSSTKIYPMSSIGYMGALYKYEIEDSNPKTPKSFIIKSASPLMKGKPFARISKTFHEAVFYQQADYLTAGIMKTPKCPYANSFMGTDSIMVLEDLSISHIQINSLNQTVPLEVMKMHIRELAQLQSYWWKSPELSSEWLHNSRAPISYFMRSTMWKRCMPKFIKAYRNLIPTKAMEDFLENSLPKFNAMQKYLNGGDTITLMHTDYRVGNFIYPPDLKSCVVLDWQFMGSGNPCSDLNFMLVIDLEVEQRQKHEEELLKYYYSCLSEKVRSEYSYSRVVKDYKICSLYTSMFTNIASLAEVQIDKEDPNMIGWSKRRIAAIEDHWDEIVNF